MNLTSRSLVAAIAVLAVAVGLGFVVPTTAVYLLIVGVIGALATFIAGTCPLPTGLEKLPLALGQAAEGKTPEPPQQTSPVVSGVFHQTQQLAASVAQLKESNKHDRRTIQAVRRAIDDLINGRDISHDDLLEEAGMLASFRHLAQLRAEHASDSATHDSDEVASDLGALEQTTNTLDTVVSQLDQDLTHLTAIGETADESLEHLSKATKLSSVHLNAMVETREKLRGEFEDLISHARETGTSIEEMAFSIQEVAKNVDALALTAEETSSSMNEMDVAIEQVQSNATDTTRLSEKVTRDAEQGGQAIMKTIEEIQRIDESTREAVEVIANLGTRIEAISGILRVIDDVAEQTNLLALNAAIIAAQAGEHGKGFAVVADEIKDLADRAGTSTREIAELTRTIQAESKNAVMAVQRGAENVKRGVEVSNEAEYALKQILESSRKSTAMVQTIARATLEQTRGSRQVTDAISTIAQTVQQIATTTNEQAKSSEFVMRGVETIRQITDRVEQGETEQHHITSSVIEALSKVDKATHSLKHRSDSLADVAVDLRNQVGQIKATTASQREVVGRLSRKCKPSHR